MTEENTAIEQEAQTQAAPEAQQAAAPESSEVTSTNDVPDWAKDPAKVVDMVRELREENKARRLAMDGVEQKLSKLSEYEKAEQARKEAEMSELEKAQAKLKEMEAKAAEAELRYTSTVIDDAIKSAARKAGWNDSAVDDAPKLVDRAAVKIEDGKVIGAEDVTKEALKAKPYLAAGTAGTRAPGGGPTPDSEASDWNKMTYAEQMEVIKRDPDAARRMLGMT